MVPQHLIPVAQRPARLQHFLESLSQSQGHSKDEPWTVLQLAGDASSRQYFRASTAQSGSIIVTLYPQPFSDQLSAAEALRLSTRANAMAPLSYANDPLAQLEMTGFLAEHDLPVPWVMGYNAEAGCIAFQDLGDVRLIEALEGVEGSERRRLYAEALRLVVRLQDLTPVLQNRAAQGRPLVGSVLSFDTAKLMWEMDFFLEHYFSSYRHTPLSPTLRAAMDAELRPLCQWLAHRPAVLCHRDYHARNLLMHQGRLFLIDYQDARLGPMTYDLVSILLDPYAPTDDLDHTALLEEFCELRHCHRNFSFMQEWQAMAIQRLLKACGTYAFQTGVRRHEGFEQYLVPTLARVVSLLDARGDCPILLGQLRSSGAA